jgi:hypothetical protein
MKQGWQQVGVWGHITRCQASLYAETDNNSGGNMRA